MAGIQGLMQGDYVIEKIQIGDQIGKGENARILTAVWEGLTVAVKEVHCIFMIFDQTNRQEWQRLREHFLSECRLSSRISHPNIVRFLAYTFHLAPKLLT